MQYEKYDKTLGNDETKLGQTLLDEDRIKLALAHKTIKRWAYIAHTEDVYSEKDYINNPEHVEGTKKPKHWHIVIEMGSNPAEVETIAKWFGISSNYIDVPKGRGAFLDCCEYLTHEAPEQQALGKHLYNDKDIKANFDFRTELNKRTERKLKYGKDLNDKDTMLLDVLQGGKTLLECQQENPLLYAQLYNQLKTLRMQYIQNMNPPTTRINYYISGRGGIGKGLCSKALARTLFSNLKNDDEIFFVVGAGNALFEGYDGQPVIIWDDMRAFDMIEKLGDRGNVFRVLDTHPTKQRQNIKYGSVNLCNSVNIINSVQNYKDFLDGLAGEYTKSTGEKVSAEDKGQSYRRMPFIINLHEKDFDLLVNKGFLEDSAEFEEFKEYKNIVGNFQQIRSALPEEQALLIEAKTLTKPKEEYENIKKKDEMKHQKDVNENIFEMFENFGSVPSTE